MFFLRMSLLPGLRCVFMNRSKPSNQNIGQTDAKSFGSVRGFCISVENKEKDRNYVAIENAHTLFVEVNHHRLCLSHA